MAGGELVTRPSLAVATAARSQQQDRNQAYPGAHRVHDHRAGEVMKLLAKLAFIHACTPKC